MEPNDEEDSGDHANQATSIEELRLKRLAYFNSPERSITSQRNPTKSLNSPQSLKFDGTFQSKEQLNNAENARNKQHHFAAKTHNDLVFFASSQNINNEPQKQRSLNQVENSNLEQKIPCETPSFSTKMYQRDERHKSFPESQDFEPISVFNSAADLSELGLSTHRPESVSGGVGYKSNQDGGLLSSSNFNPSGSRKMARDIFGDKTSEQMRSALGDQGFEDLLSKVNKNLSFHREQSAPDYNNLNANNRAETRTALLDDGKHLTREQLSTMNPGTYNCHERNEGEKKVRTLSRSYDKMTIPKNTRNSFSADEIYQQAFGGYQDLSVSGSFERDRYNSHYHKPSNHPSWNDRYQHSHPVDLNNPPKRRFSLDGMAEGTQYPPSHYQLQMAPLACPPMHVPPPGYNSGRSGVPMSPHLPASPTSLYGFHGSAPPGYFYNGQFRAQYLAQNQHMMQSDYQNQHGHPPYPHQFIPQSPSSMPPHSPNGFHYPPPAYNGSQHSVPRFPHGVPLHLPPPPVPPHMKPGAMPQSYPAALSSARSFHGGEEGMKIPHPPTAPPALKLKDGETEDHRRVTTAGSVYRAPHNPYHHHNWEEEGPPNSYNLQRYFSSMDMNRRASFADGLAPEPIPLSGHTVEGDAEKKYAKTSTEFFSEGEDIDEENDDATSCSSGFTSVTANTMATGKAGGLTRRLENLGVDLQHLRYLRVVDGKHDQETADANFEKLSKGIRYCPECSAANKAYMDWCLGCGEILIGVEPSLPGQRSRQNESSSGNNSKSEKQAGRASARVNKGVAEHSGVRESSRRSSRSKSQNRSNTRSASKSETYTPQESPESGKGLSLSSSPVRYRREQEETYEDPKDSGRASSSDAQDRFRSTPNEIQKESEEDSYSADDLEVMDEEDFMEEEGVEYDYQDSEPNFFEQIKDPVLREFIISYRNKQIMKEGQASVKENLDDTINHNSQNKSSNSHNNSLEFYDETVKESMAEISKIAGTRTSQFNIEFDPKTTHISIDENSQFPGFEKVSCGNSKTSNNDDVGSTEVPKKREKRKKKKPRKKKEPPMDVEIFGYDEIRQSRDSSRASNTHSIPLLNLAGSSEEEDDEEMTSDEDDDVDSEDVDLYNNDDETEDKVKDIGNMTENSFYSNAQRNSIHEDISSKSSEMYPNNASNWKGKGSGFVPQPGFSLAPASASSKGNNSNNSRQSVNESFKGDVSVKRGRVFHASRGGRQGEVSGYQRHWARSSTAWSSYHPRELSTRSSLNTTGSETQNKHLRKVNGSHRDTELWGRDSSVRSSQNGLASGDKDGKGSRPSSGSSVSSNGGASGIPVRQRPSSAEYSRRVSAENRQRPSSAQVRSSQTNNGRPRSGSHTSQDQSSLHSGQPHPKFNNYVTSADTQNRRESSIHGSNSQIQAEDNSASPRLLCPELHRLPQGGSEDEHADKLHAMAKNSYDKLQQMTPRISGGEVSIWQCLPDELWLYVFEFVSHADLSQLMRSCQYFYRLANDETLWKYITVRSKLAVNDVHLAAIAQHRPLSLAMVMCNGRDLSQDSLHSFFHETQGRLKELNICGCSHGSLGGALVLETAAQYCHGLTHLDASYCNLTDASLEAIAMCAERLESLCVNGFQSLGDVCLLKVLRKHGRSLRTLELYACFSLSASSLRSLGEHCTSLKKLCLGSCNKLTDSAMVTLSAQLARIEELDLRGCKNLKNDCIRKIVRNCPRLNRLVLANCPHISDLALTEIATHLKTTLRTLELCGCNNVTDQGLTTLAKNCDRLVNVDISSTKCSSTSVYQLASNSCSRWLETVKLSFLTPLSEASVVSLIRQCPRLKVVHVFGCTSLRNLAKLRQLNKNVSVEGDENFTRFSHSIDDS